MSVFRRGKSYFIDYRFPPGRSGTRIRERVGPNKEEAVIRLAERLEEIRHGLDPRLKRIKPMAIEDAVVEFLEDHVGVQVEVVRVDGKPRIQKKPLQTCVPKKKDTRMPIYNAMLLLWSFDGAILQAITTKAISDYITSRQMKGVSGQTINHQIRLLGSMFKWAVDRGYAAENPVKRIKKFREGPGRSFFLDADQASSLLEKIDALFRLLLLAALHTAARRGELIKLTWADLDLEKRLVTFRDTKNGEDRTVPLGYTLVAEFKRLPRPIAGGPVFRTDNGDPLTPTIVCRPFRIAVAAAGLAGFRFHDLRHSGASFMVQAGVPLNTVRAILGHKSYPMVLRYAHLAPEHQREAVRVLDRLPQAPAGDVAPGEAHRGPRAGGSRVGTRWAQPAPRRGCVGGRKGT